ncbi:Sodium/potassium/calcium exchanger 5 [Frankliniella fusca]|uniref:Sodium/potassium/calcium exchanger 5 n=1 Tax=Frankliniella fusca TaxID=407009 RepID=A0AAE1LP26_9NEOP|nr:Sodium/potassium/calcium exchanger 5 [Frankliniella fusca]
MTVAAALWVLGVVCGSAALVPVGAAPSPGPGPGTSSGAGPAPTPVLAFGYATPRVPSAFETGGGRISEDRQLLASTQGNLRHAEDINFDARDRDSNALGGSPARAPAPTQGAAEQAPQCEGDAEDALFPGELFDQTQLRHGAVIIYFIFAFYGFLVIAMVCENYFLPTVEIICEELGLSPDVAGATFMSLASSAPELFVNVVTTFVTKSTMGVGTTVGSATFNVLGLASFIGLASRAPIQIRAGPVVRDSLMYVSAIAITTCVVMDGSVEWYEALAMVLCSLAYMLFMFSQHRLARWARSLVSRSNSTIVLTTPKHGTTHDDESASADSVSTVDVSAVMSADPNAAVAAAAASPHCDTAKEEPQGQGCVGCLRRFSERFWLVVTWPVSFALAHTIIDSKKPKMRPFFFLTFILCVVWIALAAYVVSWMLAVIGNTLGISDSVMGITLLAAGGSTPEAVSAIIMSRKGVGSVGIANGLGANTLNMLMNLGMPWLVRSLTEPGKPWTVLSRGLTFDLVALVSAVGALNLILLLSRYRLGRSQGVCTFGVYLLFIVMLCLIELNVFGWLPPLNCRSS